MAQEAILIKEKGVVTLNKSFDFMCSQLRNGRYKLIIERYTEPRTLSQNALMWLWFTCIEQETGIPCTALWIQSQNWTYGTRQSI